MDRKPPSLLPHSANRASRTAVLVAGLGAGLIASVTAAPAAAAPLPSFSTAAPIAVLANTCPLAPVAIGAPAPSKSSAILGGHASALDAIRAQQASPSFITPTVSLAAAPSFQPPLEPGAGGGASLSQGCAAAPFPVLASLAAPVPMLTLASAQPSPVHVPVVNLAMPQPAAPDSSLSAALPSRGILDSRRVEIKRTLFDSDWTRVKGEKLNLGGDVRRVVRATGSDRQQQLATINSWVNRRITYVEDRELFGQADYWAGPGKTLRLGKGDCEDFALLKMHMLAAAGVPRSDMIITIARDLVRRADHAVLIVKTESGHVMLDNASDDIVDASLANDYRPVLSFGASQKWLHGY